MKAIAGMHVPQVVVVVCVLFAGRADWMTGQRVRIMRGRNGRVASLSDRSPGERSLVLDGSGILTLCQRRSLCRVLSGTTPFDTELGRPDAA